MLENQTLYLASLKCQVVAHRLAHLPFHLGEGYHLNEMVNFSWPQNCVPTLKVPVLICHQ